MSKVYDLVNVESMSGPITPQRTEHHFIDQLVATNKECNKKIEELENLVRHLESEKKNNEWTIQSLTARCQHLTGKFNDTKLRCRGRKIIFLNLLDYFKIIKLTLYLFMFKHTMQTF